MSSSFVSSQGPTCSGRAAQALAVFRQREAELKAAGQKKPDMVAYSELRHRWAPPRRKHGELEGVPIGLKLHGRGEAAILGIHNNILKGIDALSGQSCFAICLSGGYADDDDRGEDGSIIYTGSGGQKGRRQVEDQKRNADNVSLIRSCDSKLPIRVLRGHRDAKGKPEYIYEGLYTCVSYEYKKSIYGPQVYTFTLKPIGGKYKPRSFSVKYAGPAAAAVGTASAKDGAHCRIDRKICGKRARRPSDVAVFDSAAQHGPVTASAGPQFDKTSTVKRARRDDSAHVQFDDHSASTVWSDSTKDGAQSWIDRKVCGDRVQRPSNVAIFHGPVPRKLVAASASPQFYGTVPVKRARRDSDHVAIEHRDKVASAKPHVVSKEACVASASAGVVKDTTCSRLKDAVTKDPKRQLPKSKADAFKLRSFMDKIEKGW